MTNKSYTLITGASEGIGEAFARECASRNHNLIIIARNQVKLSNIKLELENLFNINIIILQMDLSKKDAAKSIYEYCIGKNINVDLIINNAGFGFTNTFDNLELDYCENIINLNNLFPLQLSKLFAPMMKNHSSYIMNISSMAGLLPVPFKSVYVATKYFITGISLSLFQEFKNSGPHICVVCPGGVPTNEKVVARMNQYSGLKKASFTPKEFVAKYSLDKMYQKNLIIIPGFLNKLSYIMMRITPLKLRLKLLEKTIQQELDYLGLK